MRDVFALAVWTFVILAVIVFIGVPVGVMSLLGLKRKGQR